MNNPGSVPFIVSDESSLLSPAAIADALKRARLPILTMAVAYAIPLLVGLAMVHSGNRQALSFRDRLVGRATASDPASLALQRGSPLTAAMWDFSRNLVLGAVPSTVGGLAIVIPYPVAAYRGWVGGIVSVDGKHRTRFATWESGSYYVITLVLQLIPYTLAGGAGIALGFRYLRRNVGQRLWHGFPIDAIRDVLRIYAIIVPLFFVASLWEFLRA